MKRTRISAAILAGLLLGIQVSAVGATGPSPSPCPSGSAASGARVTCPAATPDPNQAALDQLRTRLGGDIATGLATQQRLDSALRQTSASVQVLTDEISQEEAVIATLEDQIAQLDTQIADTQARIDVEKQQVAAMAAAMAFALAFARLRWVRGRPAARRSRTPALPRARSSASNAVDRHHRGALAITQQYHPRPTR